MPRAYLVRWPNVKSAAGASGLKCHPPDDGGCDAGGLLLADDSGSGWAEAGLAADRTRAFRTILPVVPGATFVT